MNLKNAFLDNRVQLLTILTLTLALYWPGLTGPFLFDDFWNLAPVKDWHEGAHSWHRALVPFPESFVSSRPLSMASFMLTTYLGGTDPFAAKAGNLALHLVCGLLVWCLAKQILRSNAPPTLHADKAALFIVAVWLLHPLHVSTVLYSIQRMSQIAAVATLASLLIFIHARKQLEYGARKKALINLFISFPLVVATGTLAKQNVAVAPLLCLVIELGIFRASSRPRIIKGFFTAFLALPACGAGLVLLLRPEVFLAGYQDWGFTLTERLITQPRVLCNYIATLIMPYTPKMGLYTDDFAPSQGLLSPVTTSLSFLALAGASVFTWKARAKAPTLFVGWFFFLGAHSVEASFLPIEMYYEHRNYLPSLGLFLAIVGLGAFLPKLSFSMNRTFPLLAGAIVAVLAIATLGRVLVWQHRQSIIEQGARHHPLSMRAASDLASLQLDREDIDAAIRAVAPLTRLEDPRSRIFGNLYIIGLECRKGNALDHERLAAVVADAMPQTTVYEAQMFRFVDNAINFGQCRGRSEREVADAFAAILHAADQQSEATPNKYVLRDIVARIYLRGGADREAEHQALTAWSSGHHPPTGAFLARLHVRRGNMSGAQEIVAKLEQYIDDADVAGQEELRQLRALLTTNSSVY